MTPVCSSLGLRPAAETQQLLFAWSNLSRLDTGHDSSVCVAWTLLDTILHVLTAFKPCPCYWVISQGLTKKTKKQLESFEFCHAVYCAHCAHCAHIATVIHFHSPCFLCFLCFQAQCHRSVAHRRLDPRGAPDTNIDGEKGYKLAAHYTFAASGATALHKAPHKVLHKLLHLVLCDLCVLHVAHCSAIHRAIE